MKQKIKTDKKTIFWALVFLSLLCKSVFSYLTNGPGLFYYIALIFWALLPFCLNINYKEKYIRKLCIISFLPTIIISVTYLVISSLLFFADVSWETFYILFAAFWFISFSNFLTGVIVFIMGYLCFRKKWGILYYILAATYYLLFASWYAAMYAIGTAW